MAWAMLVMTGRVTMRGIARWAGTGGSYRTVQRWFAPALPWAALLGAFVRQHRPGPEAVDRVAGDAGMVTTAGQRTPGLERCVASVDGTPVPGRSGCTGSRVRVQTRRSVPRRVEPVVRSAAEQAVRTANADATKATSPRHTRRPGRPQGSPHQQQVTVTFPAARGRLKARRDA
jgi:putative transposase